jgi:hypothetical protein
MAVRDLLWACPLCGLTGGIRRHGRGERCTGCDAAFSRAAGADIRARSAGRTFVRPASQWLAEGTAASARAGSRWPHPRA